VTGQPFETNAPDPELYFATREGQAGGAIDCGKSGPHTCSISRRIKHWLLIASVSSSIDRLSTIGVDIRMNESRNDILSSAPAERLVADLAKALAHPARLRILQLLSRSPGCIGGDIVEAVGLAQSTVSEHLRILKAAGVINGEIDGPRICYALDPSALAALTDFIATLSASGSAGCCVPSPVKHVAETQETA
jgi:ArsR family transcriptional regulator, arsenate/arsenite/antimonite-responsive transcriptional repressor